MRAMQLVNAFPRITYAVIHLVIILFLVQILKLFHTTSNHIESCLLVIRWSRQIAEPRSQCAQVRICIFFS